MPVKESRLKLATDAAEIGIWEIDLTHGSFRANHQLRKLYGFDLDTTIEVMTQQIETRIHPEDVNLYRRLQEQIAAQEATFEIEYRLYVEDQYRYFRAWGQLHEREDTKMYVGVIVDQTKSKQAEKKLLESESRLRSALALRGIGMWSLNMNTNEIYRDEQVKRIYGMPADLDAEEQSQWVIDHLHPEDRRGYQRATDFFQAMDPRINTHFRILHNNTCRYIETLAELHDINGEPVYIGVLTDHTETRRAERTIRKANEELEKRVQKRTQELAQANQAKSHFLANMSHEIRTPMNVILGFAELLSQESKLDDKAHYRLESILNSGRHLLALINDILEVSKIEAGHVEIQAAPLDFHQFLDDIQRMFEDTIIKKSVKFLYERKAGVPRYIETDETKLGEVLMNLLSNAVKFTQQGEIGFFIDYLETSNQIQVNITDTGHGISADEKHRLFKPFEQTSSGRKTKQGSGLGLVISHEYLRLMGGDIKVHSQLNKGSRFSLRFPCVLAKATTTITSKNASERIHALHPAQDSVSVLVVDDHFQNRELIEDMLQPLGFKITHAESGIMALEQLEIQAFAVVLLDLSMPGLSGLETLQEIRGRGYHIPVVAVTANAFEKNRQEVIDAGGNGFIRKPFRKQDLLLQLKDLLNLRYVYEAEDTTAPVQTTEIRFPDKAWLNQFSEALESFEPDTIETRLAEIQHTHPMFYQKVEPLTQRFQFDAIEAWLKAQV